MRIIALSTLKAFWKTLGYADAEQPLLAWNRFVLNADWASPADVKRDLRNASILQDGRVIFNIAGNKYRLVVWVNYSYRVVYIRFIGTQEQYDAIAPQTIWGTTMKISPIRNEDDYREALRQIETLMGAQENTPDGDMLDVLVTLVEAYERKHYPMELPDPIEAIKFYMEQNGMTPKDLEPAIGRKNRVYEILNYRRPLTLKMIRNLHGQFGIPAESLIKEPIICSNSIAS